MVPDGLVGFLNNARLLRFRLGFVLLQHNMIFAQLRRMLLNIRDLDSRHIGEASMVTSSQHSRQAASGNANIGSAMLPGATLLRSTI